jgi:hypothetical protein
VPDLHPALRLREFGPADGPLRGQLSRPEVAGEWDSFDDPPEEMLTAPAYGGRALVGQLLAGQLLAGPGANRVEADTDIGNLSEQRALERAGFTREGLVRGAQWRRGQWHDRVLYSLLRSDL